MVEIYCLKCRKFTETKNVEKVQTFNNRQLLQGICVVCGMKKSKFISASGKGLSMTQSTVFHLKCTCRVTTSQDLAQN